MDIYEIFNNLRYHYEDEVVEFKKAENNFDFDDLGKYFSALSNEANLRDKEFAWLVFGVENKSREILGTTYKNSMTSLQKLKHDLGQHTTDRNTFRDIELLLSKLPDALSDKQKLIKVGNLLLAMRKAGEIEVCENRLWRRCSSHK